MKLIRYLTIICVICLPLQAAAAAAETVVDLNVFHTLSLRDTGEAVTNSYLMAGEAAVSFKSPGSQDIRGDLAISFNELGTTIDRAYLRARFPKFRLTVGKTRVGWGDGMLFNAGDLLFGSSDTEVDMTDQELRSATKWLTAVNIPLGAFSFVEAVVIPPAQPDSVERTSLGARYYTTVGSMKVETGAAYRPDHTNGTDTGMVLSPYIALQGNIGPDWYASSSVNIPFPEDLAEELKDSWMVSAGLFHMISVGWQGNLSLRLETMLRPFARWETDVQNEYGIMVYPEITYAPNESYSFSLRSILSPIDMSAAITVGGSWHVFQGFSIQGFMTTFAGDAGDKFSWKPKTAFDSSILILLGVSWVY